MIVDFLLKYKSKLEFSSTSDVMLNFKKINSELYNKIETELTQPQIVSSSSEKKEEQETLQPKQPRISYPKDLIERKVTNIVLLISILEEFKGKRDGNILPTPEIAFRRACAQGNLVKVKSLVEIVKDLDINQPGPDSGKNALMFAKEFNQTSIIDYLISIGAENAKLAKVEPKR